MDLIKVEGIRLYAYHGCLDEEAKIGTDYLVNVQVWGSVDASFSSDDLGKTMDYVSIYAIVEKQMMARAKLIEVVAHRIMLDIFKEMPIVQKAIVEIQKMHPPINGDVRNVSFQLKRKRKDMDLQ
ncbi:MAG: dihydroneopterin aldolase [Bacteroidetes bacterium]|nr:dihydroneopterin aldolase [Bacteroidota bacterium]